MADGGAWTHFVGVRLSRAALREARAAPEGGALEAENRELRGQVAELRARLDDAGSHGAAGFRRRLLGR